MSQKSKFSRDLSLPLLAVLCTTLVALFALFTVMVSQQNKLSEQRERLHLKTAVETKINFLSNNILDYSLWSDTVRNCCINPNFDWLDKNIGPYLFYTKGYSYSFIVDQSGETFYSSHDGNRSNDKASVVLGSEFPKIIQRLEAAETGSADVFAKIVLVDGRPAIVASSVILPNITDKISVDFKRRYLILVQPVDQNMLSNISSSYGLASLSYHSGNPRLGSTYLSLQSDSKRNIGYLQWQPARPGSEMGHTYLPWVVGIGCLAGALTLYMFNRSARMTQILSNSEAAARHLANHDLLTGLSNRRAMREKGMCEPVDVLMAIVFLDLDGFKEVNDLFGHQAGDELLKEATLRLRSIVKDIGFLARVGGDEFSILLTGDQAHENAIAFANKIVTIMEEPFSSNQIRMVVSASVGVALGGKGQSVDELSRFADIAMYAAKAHGKNCWRIFDPKMMEGREIRKLLESELRDAVEHGEIDVLFQPIVDARDGVICSVEALARWKSPSQGEVGPAIFIPIAEESGLIVKLSELVLRKACLAIRDLPLSLSVNISPAQFWHDSLVDDILAILYECDFSPHRIELEITEGYLLSRPDTAAEVIKSMRSKGIRVSLDDFGTGFASIGYLQRFELDRLKLDRSFVENIVSNRQAAEVTKAVISLSHALNLPITAEGVETGPQALFLALAGCDRLQGWHYGRAATVHDIEVMLVSNAASNHMPPQLRVAQ